MVSATAFDGSTDYFLRGGGLTGAADAAVGTVSFWINPDVFSVSRTILEKDTAGGVFRINVNFQGKLSLELQSPVGLLLLTMLRTPLFPTTAWTHVLYSWDTSINGQLFIDDVQDAGSPKAPTNAGNVDYTGTEWAIGALVGGGSKFDGCLSELWFDPTTRYDLTVEANRRKFITADLKAEDLGANGETPTGSSPILYLPNAFDTFGTNAGTGGDFTDQGTVAACASAPPAVGAAPIVDSPYDDPVYDPTYLVANEGDPNRQGRLQRPRRNN